MDGAIGSAGRVLSPLQWRLLDGWQRHFPLVPEPFEVIAAELGVGADAVLGELAAFRADGTVSRVGPVFRPNAIGASTLVAAAVPHAELEAVAAIVSAFAEVNHNYEREHPFNLWFVVTAATRDALRAALDRVECRIDRPLLRLPLIRDYHIDLGFALCRSAAAASATVGDGRIERARARGACDRPVSTATVGCGREPPADALPWPAIDALVGEIQLGLPLVERPYRVVAERLGCTEGQVLDTLASLLACGTITRFGVVVRHHELGYRANAMVVWDVPDARVDALGEALAREADVTLCYRRPRVAGLWPYNLFCMIHGRDRHAVEAAVRALARRHGVRSLPHEPLFSARRFKQRGARYRPPPGASRVTSGVIAGVTTGG